MIEIKPHIIDENIKEIAKNVIFDENTFIMCAKDKEEILGVGVIKLYKDYAVVEEIIFKDEYKMLGLDFSMGKAMLNFIERRNVYDTYASKKLGEQLLKSLRFVKNEGNFTEKYDYFVDLNGYFDVNCHF